MEEKELPTYPDSYFEELIEKIRKIKVSTAPARQRILDYMETTIDYDQDRAIDLLYSYYGLFESPVFITRFANMLLYKAGVWAFRHYPVTMKNVDKEIYEFIRSSSFMEDLYNYPCFSGKYKKGKSKGKYLLPDQFKKFKGSSMVLKIMDMYRFMETFCSRDTYYRRAYAILNDLDKQLLDCVDKGAFPEWIFIDYKDCGDAIFEFSHFEVDIYEPDEKYSTLYVVYRYDTTIA